MAEPVSCAGRSDLGSGPGTERHDLAPLLHVGRCRRRPRLLRLHAARLRSQPQGALSRPLPAARSGRRRSRVAVGGRGEHNPRQPHYAGQGQAHDHGEHARLRHGRHADEWAREPRWRPDDPELRQGPPRRGDAAGREELPRHDRPQSTRDRRVVDGRRRGAVHRPQPPRSLRLRRLVQRGVRDVARRRRRRPWRRRRASSR